MQTNAMADGRGNISGPQGHAGKPHKAAGFAGGGTHHDRTPLPLDQMA